MENHFQTAQTDLIGQNAICTISWPVAQNEWPKVGQGGYKELLGPVSGTSDWYFRLLSLDWYFRLLIICCQKNQNQKYQKSTNPYFCHNYVNFGSGCTQVSELYILVTHIAQTY